MAPQISRRHTRNANGFNSSVHAALATTPERGTQKKYGERFLLLFSLVLSKNSGRRERERRERGRTKKKRENEKVQHEKKSQFILPRAKKKIAKGKSITSKVCVRTKIMTRTVGFLFIASTFFVFLLSCGISVTDGARLLKSYDEDGNPIVSDYDEKNAIQRRTKKSEEYDEATIDAATREEEEQQHEEEIENTQLNRDEENELEQIEEEVAKEASSSSEDASGENHNENGDTSRRNERGGERLSEEEIREETTKFWESITGQPEGKEKDLIDKIVEAHSLESTPMDGFLMENADSECGPSGPFALLTLWNSVDEFKRQKIIDFFSQNDDEVSTSNPTWSTVAVKSLKLSGVFSTRFAGEGESKRECIANFLTNNKMRQLEDVNRAKGIETSRPHQTERQRDLAKGKQARLLRDYVLTKILPSAQTLEARGANDEATVLVLALNCKVEKRRALLFALFDAVISTFKLNANDVALSLGRRHVTQDMYELINQTPGDMLGEERGDKLSYTRGDDPIVVKAGICPTLVGKHDVDENANEGGEGFGDERDHLQRAHAQARDHFAPHRTENHHDPTNPHHQHTHGSHQMGSLPGMQSVFGGDDMKMLGGSSGKRGSSNNQAKQMGMSAFGISDHSAMQSPRSRSNEGRTQPKSNYVPTLEDPLQGYMNSHPAPRRHRARVVGRSETL